ncbi:uncharacterized protein BRPE64_CCDS07520 [Caballeronia insecticola]|uniref:Right handed beta helix domain-containing protein n=1 Tax=Caballeronia insecticola TaxID=758793 RepID=R4WZ09_9BURK|nr:uncharacterized protein BRPE64_CCDS07520 [Caballeronia insecticola]
MPESNAGGYPQDGVPSGDIKDTVPGAWWYHSVTEEIRGAIAKLGGVPDWTKTDQLATAISSSIQSATSRVTSDLAALDGASLIGFMSPHTPRLANPYSTIIANNEANYNADEGIQFGLQCGIVIGQNVLIGNGDLGIEGDTAFATSATFDTLGFEVPSQAIVIGNYIDGRTLDGTLGRGGITFSGGNEGVAQITGNIVRNVAGKMGISALQRSGGFIVVEGNMLDQCDPGALQHQIQASAMWVRVNNNTITRPGATNSHDVVFIYGSNQVALIEGNYSDAVTANCARIAPANASFKLLRVSQNTFLGSGADAIILAPSSACAIQAVDISSNQLLNVNSSGWTDKRAISVRPSSADLAVTIGRLSVRGNSLTYAAPTQYPIGLINMQAGSVSEADIGENSFGVPSMPNGNGSIDLATAVVPYQLFERSNILPGQRSLRGAAPPTLGTWAIGDNMTNIDPSANPVVGWVCTLAGSPGTWKPYGALTS